MVCARTSQEVTRTLPPDMEAFCWQIRNGCGYLAIDLAGKSLHRASRRRVTVIDYGAKIEERSPLSGTPRQMRCV